MNVIMQMGRLTKDIEIKYAANNVVIGSFNIAVTREINKPGEERQSDFFNCKAFGKTAEFIAKYFKKGKLIMVKGRLQNNNYKDRNGVMQYANEIIIEKVYFTGEKVTQESNNNNYSQQDITDMSKDDDTLPWG